MKTLVLMQDISRPTQLPGKYKNMLKALNNDGLTWHVSQYTKHTDAFVLWSEEGYHHEYTWLSTVSIIDMLMAIEYLYHHRIGGTQIEWNPQDWWIDKGYKSLVNL